jgi:hypothetical protein
MVAFNVDIDFADRVDRARRNKSSSNSVERESSLGRSLSRGISSAGTTLISYMAPAHVVEGVTADLNIVELDPEGNAFG